MENNLMSADISKLAEALAKFQGSAMSIPKNKEVQIPTKTGGKFTFSYSDLSQIISSTKKPLADNELSFTQIFSPTEIGGLIITTLMHSSGQWIRSCLPLNLRKEQKDLGGDITYYRRYSLSSILGICADDDNDVGEPLEDKKNSIKAKEEKPFEDKKISLAQVEILEAKISKEPLENWMERICTFFKVQNLYDMKEKDFEKAMNVINKTDKKKVATSVN